MRIAYIFIAVVAVLNWNCGAASSKTKVSSDSSAETKAEAEKTDVVSSDTPENIAIIENIEKKEDKIVAKSNKQLDEKVKTFQSKLADTKAVKSKSVSIRTVSDDFSTDYLMGKFDPNTHEDFTGIKSIHASSGGMRLRKDTYESFQEMYKAALKDGIRLTIISATRPFAHQKRIWEAKWFGKRKVNGRMLPPMVRDEEMRAKLILMYSSMPGTSRHHWGTDIDLNDLNNPYFEKGKGKKIYDWLVANAYGYGFCQVYSEQGPERPNGYLEEKWHWSYVPVARRLTEQYKAKIKNTDITGFEGSNTAVTIDMVNNYVLGINAACK